MDWKFIKGEHPTPEQLKYVFDDFLSRGERKALIEHILKCDECRMKAPQPTIEQFWKALDENERS
jgi:hypothetical protein